MLLALLDIFLVKKYFLTDKCNYIFNDNVIAYSIVGYQYLVCICWCNLFMLVSVERPQKIWMHN